MMCVLLTLFYLVITILARLVRSLLTLMLYIPDNNIAHIPAFSFPVEQEK